MAFFPALVTRARVAVNFPRLLAGLVCLVAASALRLDRSSQSEKRAKCGRGQYPLLSFMKISRVSLWDSPKRGSHANQ